MNKLHWLLLAVISLTISLYFGLMAFSFNAFLIFSILFWALIFVILVCLVKVVQALKAKNVKRLILFIVLAILSLSATWFLSLWLSLSWMASGIATATPHFRTNILTRQCNLGPFYDTADQWYYRDGCNISKEEKIKILKDSPMSAGIIDRCKKSPADTPVLGSLEKEVSCLDFINLLGKT